MRNCFIGHIFPFYNHRSQTHPHSLSSMQHPLFVHAFYNKFLYSIASTIHHHSVPYKQHHTTLNTLFPSHTQRTLSSMHSEPANISPTRAKFLAYDFDFFPISLRVCLAVIFSAVTGESSPDMKRPKAPPRPNPEQFEREIVEKTGNTTAVIILIFIINRVVSATFYHIIQQYNYVATLVTSRGYMVTGSKAKMTNVSCYMVHSLTYSPAFSLPSHSLHPYSAHPGRS